MQPIATSMAHILVIEPSAEVRELIEHVISSLGHVPVPCDEGVPTEALGTAEALVLEPDCPQGLALARELRARRPDLPIVCVSVREPRVETRALQPVAHVVKPFSLAQLERAIEAVAG